VILIRGEGEGVSRSEEEAIKFIIKEEVMEVGFVSLIREVEEEGFTLKGNLAFNSRLSFTRNPNSQPFSQSVSQVRRGPPPLTTPSQANDYKRIEETAPRYDAAHWSFSRLSQLAEAEGIPLFLLGVAAGIVRE
jgi:hypothetical protein